MTEIVKASNATSFPTEAQAERSKAAARVSPSVLARGDPLRIHERPSVAQTHSIPQPRFAGRSHTVEVPPSMEDVYP